MNEQERALRERVAENLRYAERLGQRVGRIRSLFEAKLSEHPLTIWSPVWGDLGRKEIWGYGTCKLEGEYSFVELPQKGQYVPTTPEVSHGRYDLTVSSDGSDLANSPLGVFGTIEGYGYMEYLLPPTSHVGGLSRQEMDNLWARINYLESLLKLIGLLSDEEN